MGKCLVDIHTHILPGVDDGSASVEESIRLLSELSKQGVTTVAATPHFYADRDDPGSFFGRRQKAYDLLKEKTGSDITVLTGAEVCYYPGISQTKELRDFSIGGTGLLLLEMPFYDWTSSVINEVISISRVRRLQVVIAHIDRYLGTKSTKYIDELSRAGVMFQLNASSLADKRLRGASLKLIKKQIVSFVASDCHNMETRPPQLGEAYEVIENKLGSGYIEWLYDNSAEFFEGVTGE